MGERQTQEIHRAMSQALAAGGFATMEQAAWEVSLSVALSKVSGYERECGAFRGKYGEPLATFKARGEAATGHEDFAVEEELADWEFAEAALTEWQHRAEILRNAAP